MLIKSKCISTTGVAHVAPTAVFPAATQCPLGCCCHLPADFAAPAAPTAAAAPAATDAPVWRASPFSTDAAAFTTSTTECHSVSYINYYVPYTCG